MCVFNILVIPGISAIAGGRQLEANRDLVYKEAQFYMLSVAVLLIMFAFAAIYNPLPTAAGDVAIRGEVDRTLAAIPLAMYGLYLFVQWQDTMDFEADETPEPIRPTKAWLLLGLSLLLILVSAALLFCLRRQWFPAR